MSVVEVPQTETEVPTTYSEILTDAEGQEFIYECTPDLETGELIEVAYDPEGNEIDVSDLPGQPTGGPAVKKAAGGSLFARMFGMCGGKKAVSAKRGVKKVEDEAAKEEKKAKGKKEMKKMASEVLEQQKKKETMAAIREKAKKDK